MRATVTPDTLLESARLVQTLAQSDDAAANARSAIPHVNPPLRLHSVHANITMPVCVCCPKIAAEFSLMVFSLRSFPHCWVVPPRGINSKGTELQVQMFTIEEDTECRCFSTWHMARCDKILALPWYSAIPRLISMVYAGGPPCCQEVL